MELEPYLKGILQDKPIKPHGYVEFVVLKFNGLHHMAKVNSPIALNGREATWDDLAVGDEIRCGCDALEYGLITSVYATRKGKRQ